MKAVKKWDREIKKRVQAVEKDIPPELEKSFLEKLEQITPGKAHPRKPPPVYYGVLAAASVVLAALLFLFLLFQQQSETFTAEAQEVWVQDASVEGEPAVTYMVKQKDPDITIFWVEKIKNKKEKPK